MSLGDFLKYIRTKHSLTQSQMGDIFYRNKDYVYLLENDKAKPTNKELMMIATKLNEPIFNLIAYGIAITQVIEEQK